MKVVDQGNTTRIVLPDEDRRGSGDVMVLFIGLFGGVSMLLAGIRLLPEQGIGFRSLLAFLAAAFPAIWIAYQLLWLAFGRRMLEVDHMTLRRRSRMLGMDWPSGGALPIHQCANLQFCIAVPVEPPRRRRGLFFKKHAVPKEEPLDPAEVHSHSALMVECDGKLRAIVSQLSEHVAKQVIAAIAQRHPALVLSGPAPEGQSMR